ncbi:MAG: protein-export chaperone SecB [Pseudomonadales bacterium]|nr:protein-export chaperone SecB [Pseudomonadales bacterium]
MSEQAAAPSETQFALQRIYIKDLSFESPRSPDAFGGQWKPRVNLELNTRHQALNDDNYEVVLRLTVTVRNEADEVVYLCEVHQAGIFLARGFDADQLNRTLGAFCPNVLFPYAREAIDSLALKGSFPPLMLAPVNFEAIYEQSRQQQMAQQQQGNPIVN